MDDDSSLRDGVSVEVVGFGCTEMGTNRGVGVRRLGVASVAARNGHELTLVAAPALPCGGDSGGPIFSSVEGRKRIAGVISHAGEDSNSVIGRTVADALEGFIRPFVAQAARGSVMLGYRCSYDEQCASGECYEPPDAPGIGYCTHDCVSSADCEIGVCQWGAESVGICGYPLPSPGALGAKCSVDEDCSGGQCGTHSPSRAKRCTTTCFADDSLKCPDGYQCLPNRQLATYAEACFRPEEPDTVEPAASGCAIRSSNSTRSWRGVPLQLIAALALWVRRRRRNSLAETRATDENRKWRSQNGWQGANVTDRFHWGGSGGCSGRGGRSLFALPKRHAN